MKILQFSKIKKMLSNYYLTNQVKVTNDQRYNLYGYNIRTAVLCIYSVQQLHNTVLYSIYNTSNYLPLFQNIYNVLQLQNTEYSAVYIMHILSYCKQYYLPNYCKACTEFNKLFRALLFTFRIICDSVLSLAYFCIQL